MRTAPAVSVPVVPEQVRLLAKLGQNPDFEKFIAALRSRRDNLAVWAHTIAEEPYATWASGRVQELSEWLALFDDRVETLAYLQSAERAAQNYAPGDGF